MYNIKLCGAGKQAHPTNAIHSC